MKWSNDWNKFLHIAQIVGFAITIAALPLNNMFMSLGTIWLASACVLQMGTDIVRKKSIKVRLLRYTRNKSALYLSSIFILALVGMLWTEDVMHGIWDLRMKLPMLILPFAVLTLEPLSGYWIRVLKGIFILSLCFSVIWCALIYFHINPKPWTNVREISVFISQIRFSLLLVLGIAITVDECWKKLLLGKIFSILITLLFCFFLYLIESMTGFAVLAAIVFWYLFYQTIKRSNRRSQMTAIATIAVLIIGLCSYFIYCYKSYFTVEEINWKTIAKSTIGGELYNHHPTFLRIEEGHYSMTHIAHNEMYSAWKLRSHIHPDSADARGHAIVGTLIRYASSKGLHKDKEGIDQLTYDDIVNIENGWVSVNEKNKNAFRKRIDNILFEYSNYKAGGVANGHSVMQRFEFWRTAIAIISKHPITGVGTGDTKLAFSDQYIEMNSGLDSTHRLRAHNQYLTMWLTYGILGFLLFVVMIFTPLFNGGWHNTLLTSFLIIAASSFLTEDTLESQAGVMFFSFFYVVLNQKPQPQSEK